MEDLDDFEDLLETEGLEECTRCGELDELNWHEHCPTCADDMGTSK